MLYEALFVPPGREPFSRSVLEEPQIAYYASGFGRRAGDIGFIAEAGGEPIGAPWVRLLQAEDPGYGYVDDDTPELTIAVTPEMERPGRRHRPRRQVARVGAAHEPQLRRPQPGDRAVPARLRGGHERRHLRHDAPLRLIAAAPTADARGSAAIHANHLSCRTDPVRG